MKKLTSILLAVLLLLQAAGLTVFAEDPPQEAAATVTVSVTIAKEGEIVTAKDGEAAALRSVTLTGKASYTVDDALRAAHDALYDGGAAVGYASAEGEYGLSMTKLWGDVSGAFGYYVDNAMAMSLSDAVTDGSHIYAFVYREKDTWGDAYAWFDKTAVTVSPDGDVSLRLSYVSGYDPETYLPVASPLNGAVLTVDGERTTHETDEDGKVELSFDSAGEYLVSAVCDTKTIVPPVCVVTVAEDACVTVTIADKDGKLAAAAQSVTLSGKTEYTVDDALRAAHESLYPGGAAAGYASAVGEYGLSMTKLWGYEDPYGGFSYYKNDEMVMGDLTEPVEDGDTVSAYVYSYGVQDAYAWFDRTVLTADAGKDVTLTLSYYTFDTDWNPVRTPLAGAAVTVDGRETSYTTDENGRVTLSFAAGGEHIVSAKKEGLSIAPPACRVTVNPGVTVRVTMANQGQFASAKDGEAVVLRELTLSGKSSYTVGDAVYALHEAFYEGGAEAGYAVSSAGWITKLWGDVSGAFGYYLNNTYLMSLDEPVRDGDHVYVFVMEDKTAYSDKYTFFDKTSHELESGGEMTLTLTGIGYDSSFNIVSGPVEGAVITIDGRETSYRTGADGSVTFPVSGAGEHLVSAVLTGEYLVPAACIVTAADDNHLSGLTVTGLTPAFSDTVTEYTIADKTYNTASVSVKALFDADRTVSVSVNGGAAAQMTSNKYQTVKLSAGKNVIAVTVTPAEGSSLAPKTYTITVVRKTALSALTLAQNGSSIALNPAFSASKYAYTAKAAVGEVSFTATAGGDSANTAVTVNGSASGTAALTEGENVFTVRAASTDAAAYTDYTVTVTAYPAVTTTLTVPAGAILYVNAPDGTALALPAPVSEGQTDRYVLDGLMKDQLYSYTVGKYGYESASGTFEAIDGYEKTITLALSTAPDEEDSSSQWKNFRNSSTNNGVTDARTPVSADTASLKWVTPESFKTGSGMQIFNPAGFVMADGCIYTTYGNSVVKLDRDTGETVASGEIDAKGAGALGVISLCLGGGKVFVPLADGRVQALDADTLESLWISESLGTQCTTSLIYDSGYVYGSTGNSTTAYLFCLSAADENPSEEKETKYATWKLFTGDNKGSYWSTPVIVGNFLIIGTDAVSSTSQLLSVNKQTGEEVSRLTLTGLGNQRSSIVYQSGRVWFTTANGTFCTAAVDRVTGALSDLQKYSNAYTYATATPVLYNNIAYVNTAVSGAKIMVAIDISDPAGMRELRRVSYPVSNANAQVSPLLTTAYEDEGKIYLYTIQNCKPGVLYAVCDDGEALTIEALYTPPEEYSEYSISSPVCDENGTIYYRNDSGYIFAVQSAVGLTLEQSTLALAVGETGELSVKDAVPGGAGELVWKSSAPTVASVLDGKVTGLSAGAATVTVSTADGKYSASCLVLVKATTVIYSENSTAYVSEPTGTLPTGGVLTHTQTRTPTDRTMKKAVEALSLLEELDGWVWSVEELELTDAQGGAFTVTAPLTAGITMSKTYLNSKKYTPVAAILKGSTLTFLDTEINGEYVTFRVTDLDATYVLLVLTNDSALEAMDVTEDTTDYDALIAKIKAADEGDTIRLNITSATQIPWEVFEALEKAEPNVTLNLVASKYQWKFVSDNVEIPSGAGKTFDPWVRLLEKETEAEKAFAGEKYLSVSFRGEEKVPGRSTLVFSTGGTEIAGAENYILYGLDEDGNVRDSSGRFLCDGDDCAITITSRAQFVVMPSDKAVPAVPPETAAGSSQGGAGGTAADLKPELTEEDREINEELAANPEGTQSVLDLSEYENFMREAVANQQALQTALTDAEAAYAAALDRAVLRTALVSVAATAAAAVLLWGLSVLLRRKKNGGAA